MYSYNEVHKENSRDIEAKTWKLIHLFWSNCKNIQNPANQIRTNKSRNVFKLPVKTHDLEIRKDENLEQLSNRWE